MSSDTKKAKKKNKIEEEALLKAWSLMCTAKEMTEVYELNFKLASKYVHLSGKGHVNAVLEAGGLDIENGTKRESVSMLNITNCPNCDRSVDQDMIQCGYCGFILDPKMRINQQDELATLKKQNLEMQEQIDDIMKWANVPANLRKLANDIEEGEKEE